MGIFELLAIILFQSFFFWLYLKETELDNAKIWDLFFLSLLIFILTGIVGYFLKMYFPIYFLLLLVFFYGCVTYKYLSDIGQALVCFSIEVFVYFVMHILFSLKLTMFSIGYAFFILIGLSLSIYSKKHFIYMYLLPVLWYIGVAMQSQFGNEVIGLLFHSHIELNLPLIDTLYIILLIIGLCIIEIRINHVLSKKEIAYEDILKFKEVKRKSPFQLDKVGI